MSATAARPRAGTGRALEAPAGKRAAVVGTGASAAPNGIVTADGRLREVDCLIWATGFQTNDFMFPMRIVANWPGYMCEYLRQTSQLDAAEYRFAPLSKPATVMSA
jgi:cation diffusion facilitator CzcD-associated flavoprotein CzcO